MKGGYAVRPFNAISSATQRHANSPVTDETSVRASKHYPVGCSALLDGMDETWRSAQYPSSCRREKRSPLPRRARCPSTGAAGRESAATSPARAALRRAQGREEGPTPQCAPALPNEERCAVCGSSVGGRNLEDGPALIDRGSADRMGAVYRSPETGEGRQRSLSEQMGRAPPPRSKNHV